MKIRQVQLHGGPCDGQTSVASHSTAVVDGNVYVWDGGLDRNRFGYLEDVLHQVSKKELEAEEKVIKIINDSLGSGKPLESPVAMEEHRLNAWAQAVHYGVERR